MEQSWGCRGHAHRSFCHVVWKKKSESKKYLKFSHNHISLLYQCARAFTFGGVFRYVHEFVLYYNICIIDSLFRRFLFIWNAPFRVVSYWMACFNFHANSQLLYQLNIGIISDQCPIVVVFAAGVPYPPPPKGHLGHVHNRPLLANWYYFQLTYSCLCIPRS